MPFFSVLIPLYNKTNFIESTLNSVFNQSFTDFEVIIVDDGSTDNSLHIVEKFKDKRLSIYKQHNQGVSVARNLGIEQANSQYIALLDADDLWYSNHLQELKKLIETFPEAGLFCMNYEINYNGGFVKPATFNFDYKNECIVIEDFFKANIINFIPSSSSVALAKDKILEVGKYNTSLRTGQDIDLWIKFALKYSVAFNPNITMTYNNFVSNSLSKSTYNEDRYQLINNYALEEKTNLSLKRYLDINRYTLAIRCTLNNEVNLSKKARKEINLKNLNLKQKLLLKCSKKLLIIAKKLQVSLFNKGIYFSANK